MATETETQAPEIERDLALRMYEQMRKIRVFEEHVDDLYRSRKMPGLAHLYIGEEAVAVGVCETLNKDDYITSTHRGHGHCLAKGADVERMFCELLGKEEGYCRGKGGSMHIADHANGNLGANAIVGGSAGIATGAGFAAQRLGSDRVSVCFFGEGALGQGLLYEVMNMASLWKLPVIYVCENNLYNEYTSYLDVTAGSITARAEAFGIPSEEIDGQDVVAVYEATSRAVERARSGAGPSFLLCATYRFLGHHVGDVDHAYYRSKDEEETWTRERDPIALFSSRFGDGDEVDRVRARVEAEVAAAVEYALAAPFPEPGEVTEDVYA
jgi:TPP-dependent pyruvate/acetoin dehydrogenase alpha subunit